MLYEVITDIDADSVEGKGDFRAGAAGHIVHFEGQVRVQAERAEQRKLVAVRDIEVP